MTRDELIVALEVATVPSRELDEWIATVKSGATREVQKDGSIAHHKNGFWVSVGKVLPYTASIDAALTLVRDGWFVEMKRFSDGWYVRLKPHSASDLGYDGTQKPAAISLCIAALKARTE